MGRFRRISAAVLLAILAFVPDRSVAQEAPPKHEQVIIRARRLIAEGKLIEAKIALDDFLAAAPKDPGAKKVGEFVDRIKSVEIFIDYSHEVVGNADLLANALRLHGFGITRNHAYIPVHRARLSECELVVLWQQTTPVKYGDLEYAALLDYVKGGGRLLLITEPARWMAARRGASIKRYPLRQLARRFGLRLRKGFEEISLGEGKVFHYRNTKLLTKENLTSEDPETRGAVVALFQKALPYPMFQRSAVNERLEPEIKWVHGRLTFYYAQTMRKPGLWAKKALPTALGYLRELYGGKLEHDITITGVAGIRGDISVGNNFPLSLAMDRDAILQQLALKLHVVWMRPKGTELRYPYWMAVSWSEMVALDLLKRLGAERTFRIVYRHRRRMFRTHDPEMTAIDLSKGPGRDELYYAYVGKAQFVYDDLTKRYGPSLLRRFREMVFLYHDAGKIGDKIDTAETIRLLSLATGKDLFPYFRALGTRVKPLKINFAEPRRLRKRLEEKEKKAEETKAGGG